MKDRILIFIIGLLVGVIITTLCFFIYSRTNNNRMMEIPKRGEMPPMMQDKEQFGEFRGNPNEESVEKETTAEKVEEGVVVTDKNIDLSKYSSNITINKSGNYTLTGEFSNAVLVNADGEVTLNLNNVIIKNNITSAIANISTNSVIINLLENTTNILSDGGSSEYDGCLFSAGPLIIEGKGTLNVYGNQEEGEGIATDTNDITINGGKINIECNDDGLNAGGDGGIITLNDGEVYIKASGDGIDSNKNLVINGGKLYTMGSSLGGDAGIDTDGGFVINAGTIIALGSDMLQSPDTTSKQKSACFNLSNKISAGTKISLKNEQNEEVISFEANEDFKTLIVSNVTIKNGTYYLYINGEKTEFKAIVK